MGGDGAEEEEGFGERERGEVQKKPFSSLSLSLRPRSLAPSSSTYASPPQQQQTTSTVLVLNSPFWRFPASFVPLKCRTKFFSFHHFSLVFDEEKRQSSSVSLFSLFSLFLFLFLSRIDDSARVRSGDPKALGRRAPERPQDGGAETIFASGGSR